jgi:hypothetical protein
MVKAMAIVHNKENKPPYSFIRIFVKIFTKVPY